MIKDSGDRTEFETGAKRDMHVGKGRMEFFCLGMASWRSASIARKVR